MRGGVERTDQLRAVRQLHVLLHGKITYFLFFKKKLQNNIYRKNLDDRLSLKASPVLLTMYGIGLGLGFLKMKGTRANLYNNLIHTTECVPYLMLDAGHTLV